MSARLGDGCTYRLADGRHVQIGRDESGRWWTSATGHRRFASFDQAIQAARESG